MVVVLPAPFAPIRATTVPAFTSSDTPTSTSLVPYPACRFSTVSTAPSYPSSSLRGCSGACRIVPYTQIGLDHLGIAFDLHRRSGGDDLAAIEYRHAPAQFADHIHVMIDLDDADASFM